MNRRPPACDPGLPPAALTAPPARPAPRLALAVVVAEFPSLSETFVLRELAALKELGWALTVFALRPPRSTRVHGAAVALAIPVHTLPPALSWRSLAAHLRALVTAPRTLARVYRRPFGTPLLGEALRALRLTARAVAASGAARAAGVGRVHAHFAYVTADAGLALAECLGVPFSVSAHAWDLYATRPQDLARRLQPADVIITCAHANRDYLLSRVPQIPAGRVQVVYHGVDPALFPGAVGPGSGVLAVGRLEEKKGFTHLVDACRLLADRGISAELTLVGDGQERERLERRVAGHGLAGQVRMTGPLTQEELAPLLRSAALVAVPSVPGEGGDRDVIPNVILEAMAAGLPVVASRLPGITEAVEHERTGLLVPPGEPALLAAALERLLADAPLRARLGQAARARVLERFDIRLNARLISRILQPHSADTP